MNHGPNDIHRFEHRDKKSNLNLTDLKIVKGIRMGGNNDVEYLLGKIVDAASKNVKSVKRQKCINSHLKHIKDIELTYIYNKCTFTPDSIHNFLSKKFSECLKKNKEFSKGYWISVLSSIARHYNVINFKKGNVLMMINNIKKILYSENTELTYVINDKKVTFPESINQLRKQYKSIQLKRANRVIYTTKVIQEISKYFSIMLINYLEMSTGDTDDSDKQQQYVLTQNPNKADIELAIFVLFLIVSPKRTQQILQLSLQKIEQLIQTNQTEIKSKTKINAEFLIIPKLFGMLLKLYVKKTFKHNADPNTRFFTFKYKKYYNTMKKHLKILFPEYDYINRIFHGFRNYYAELHKNNGNISQYSLGHSANVMTNKYVQNQENFTKNETLQNFINDNFPNKLPIIQYFLCSKD